MVKQTNVYICQQCGYRSPTYLGRCPQCDNWNTFVETMEGLVTPKAGRRKTVESAGQIIRLNEVNRKDFQRITTKILEFDRCLGGGIVPGSVVLVSGDPGIGKSTLLTHLALNLENTLYIAGEESPQQIKLRADRIKLGSNLAALTEIDVDIIASAIEKMRPSLVIVDSIQTLETTDLVSAAGSVSQVRESANRLQRLAKDLHIPIFLIGHVTKEGTIAGPKTLEHLVDVILSLEGDPSNQFRVLRGNKNRFGPTDEVGIFEMTERGMEEVKNPSKLFVDERVNAPGSAVVATVTGLRPLLVEIQALVTKTTLPIPRRTGSGVDNNRLQLLTAVLQKRLKLPLFDQDIFVNVVGGLRISEPAADLGICMAIISSFEDKVVRPKTILLSEVGLLGELRPIRNLDKRVAEAKKLGFVNVISSQNIKNLQDAVKVALE